MNNLQKVKGGNVPKPEISAARRNTSRSLFIIALPLVFLGLIDPLEGGLALIAASLVYLVAFLVAGRGPNKILWIPFVSAVGIGLVVLGLAIFGMDRVDNQPQLIPLSLGNWIYRAAVLVTLAGAVFTVINSFRTIQDTSSD